MKKLFTLVGSILMAGAMHAATIPAATSADITTALVTAVDGDIIELTANTYSTATFTISKKMTFKASTSLTAAPVLTGVSFTMNTGGALEIDGLELDGNNSISYMIQATSSVGAIHEYFRIKNCKIYNYTRSVIRSDNWVAADIPTSKYAIIGEITVNNCNISTIGAGSPSYSVFGVKTARVTTASITNSTFSNCSNGIYYSEQSESQATGLALATCPITFNMQNVTIYNCGAASAKNIINFTANPNSNYTIDKTIMWGVFNSAYTGTAISIGTPTGGTTNVTNSIVNVNSNAISATLTTDTRITDVPVFTLDAALKITASQTLKDLYDAGTVVGDPRGYPMTVALATKTKDINASGLISFGGKAIQLSQVADVEIFSIAGKKVTSAQNVTSVPTLSLQNGIYLVKASAENQTEVLKISVQ